MITNLELVGYTLDYIEILCKEKLTTEEFEKIEVGFNQFRERLKELALEENKPETTAWCDFAPFLKNRIV